MFKLNHTGCSRLFISSDYNANTLDLTILGKEDEEILEKDIRLSVINKKDPRQQASQIIKIQIY